MRDLPPPPAAIDRAAALAGPGATVRGTRALAGGTHARTYLIQTADPEREFVVRQFPAGDDAATREARVLASLAGLGGLAPRLLAGHPDGPPPDGSWILISRLPGTADITPGDPSAFARQLGGTLARIHATARHCLAGLPSLLERPGGSPAGLSGPAAGIVAASWAALAGAPTALTHHDFWSGNTLWQDGTLTGVVDWTGAARGPRAFDLGWCRLDLYLLYGDNIAGTFLGSYQAAGGAAPADPLLGDLWAAARAHQIVESWVPNYRDLGRTDLTARVLRDRLTIWTQRLIERWTGTTATR
jgi:aminoglycoside phosphotransferase (APT) family kinase protein